MVASAALVPANWAQWLGSPLDQCGFDDLEAGGGLVRVDDQRRTYPHGACPGGEQEESAPESGLHHLRRLFRRLQLERQHEPQTADVRDLTVRGSDLSQAVLELRADPGCVVDEAFLQQVQRDQPA